MKQHNIVKRLIVLSLKENFKLFVTQLIWAIILGLFMAVVDYIYSIRVLPIYFIFLFISTFLISKNSSTTIQFGSYIKKNSSYFLYNNSLPLTYFQKFIISIAQNIFNSFYMLVSFIYFIHLMAPVFIDFSGFLERDLFTLFCTFQLIVILGYAGDMKINDRLTSMDLGNIENVKILILNLVLCFTFILVLLFDYILLNELIPNIIDKISSFYVFIFFMVFFDLVLLRKIMTNARVDNEHKSFRFKQSTLKKQFKIHAQGYACLIVFNLFLGGYIVAKTNTNYKAYQIATLIGLNKPSYGGELIHDKPEEFVSYYKEGMPQDKKYKWFTEGFILKTFIRNDSLEAMKSIIPVGVASYDNYYCEAISKKGCREGTLLNFALRNNSEKISRFLLGHESYKVFKNDFKLMITTAAQDCNGRSIAALIDSGVSVNLGDGKKNQNDVYDVLAKSRDGRCRLAMRDLLKQHLKN